MVTQSFNAFIRSAQRKMQYGNQNEGVTDERRLMDLFYLKGIDEFKSAISDENPDDRVLGLCEVMLFCLKCFDTDFTVQNKELRERSYPEQIFALCIACLKAMNVDIKNTLHELIKHHASLNKGYHDKDGNFIKYKCAEKSEDIIEEHEEVENGWRTKSGEFYNKIYFPQVIYK